jgi:centromere/kinetochore protein ZW10
MSAETITPAVLQFVETGAYPSEESVFSATLQPADLSHLLQQLRAEQSQAKDALRGLSRTAAPDVDDWIERARTLQADIQRSRDTARDIVQAAEIGREHVEKVKDARAKVDLLEKEVKFNASLEKTLLRIREINADLSDVKSAVVEGDLQRAVDKFQTAEKAFAKLDLHGTGAAALLERRLETLRDEVNDMALQRWNSHFSVDAASRTFAVKGDVENGALVQAVQALGLFDARIVKLAKDLERSLLRPRMVVSREETVFRMTIASDSIACDSTSDDTTTNSLLKDLTSLTQFLATRLPQAVSLSLSQHFIPFLVTRLEDDWLSPSLPSEIDEMPDFQQTLGQVASYANRVNELGWHGAQTLLDWEKNVPRVWLTKRRELLLGEVRNLVFTGIHETEIVERVETQTVKEDETGADATEGGDEWDAWDETAEETTDASTSTADAPTGEEDEFSAWDAPDTEDTKAKDDDNEDDEGEAWGWEDGQGGAENPSGSPKTLKKQPSRLSTKPKQSRPSERQITHKETYQFTAVPPGIIQLIQRVIHDAQTLSQESHLDSPITPAATGLYSLPTLALAIYRATATTAYANLPSGSIQIYNDATHLALQLQALQAAQPPTSRLRLDGDIETLHIFARTAYTTALSSHRTILHDLLDGAQGFGNCTNEPYKSACEAAVSDALHHLRTTHTQFAPILSSTALLQSTGSLLATLNGKIIADVLELPDISEADSKQLRDLIESISQVRDLFSSSSSSSLQEIANDDDENNNDRNLMLHCPNWTKLQYLSEVMVGSLADIKHFWHEAGLSLDFSAEEVVGLIEALFAESPLRRQAIGEIRRGAAPR